jgi:hypothetical protein
MQGITFVALFWLLAMPEIDIAFVLLTIAANMTTLFTTWAGMGRLAN